MLKDKIEKKIKKIHKKLLNMKMHYLILYNKVDFSRCSSFHITLGDRGFFCHVASYP